MVNHRHSPPLSRSAENSLTNLLPAPSQKVSMQSCAIAVWRHGKWWDRARAGGRRGRERGKASSTPEAPHSKRTICMPLKTQHHLSRGSSTLRWDASGGFRDAVVKLLWGSGGKRWGLQDRFTSPSITSLSRTPSSDALHPTHSRSVHSKTRLLRPLRQQVPRHCPHHHYKKLIISNTFFCSDFQRLVDD